MRCVPSSQLVFGVLSQPLWSITCTLYFHVVAASSASHAPTCVCCHALRCFFASPLLLPKTNFCFGFGLSASQSFHSSTRQWKLSAYCKAAPKLIPFVLNRDCSHLRQISSVQPRSLLCQLICFLMAFSDELLEKRHFLVECALTCSTSTHTPS